MPSTASTFTVFTISNDNVVTAFPRSVEPKAEVVFKTQDELAAATASWPIGRFTKIWNEFAGVVPFCDLKHTEDFRSQKVAVSRIWEAIQLLAFTDEPKKSSFMSVATKKRKATATLPMENLNTGKVTHMDTAVLDNPVEVLDAEVLESTETDTTVTADDAVTVNVLTETVTKTPKAPKAGSKKDTFINLLKREGGVSLTELMATTDWQIHSVRGFISNLTAKDGLAITKVKNGKETTYSL